MRFDSISSQWIELTRRCIRSGHPIRDEDVALRELLGVSFEIVEPSVDDPGIEAYGDPEMIRAMTRNFIDCEPQFGYSFAYGERIWEGGEESNYERVRSTLARKPESKSASMSLLDPRGRSGDHIPCITTIDFKVRCGSLHLFYFARSQDLLKKSYADNIALHAIQRRLAMDLRVSAGTISGFIASGHVYEKDLDGARSLEPFRDATIGGAGA